MASLEIFLDAVKQQIRDLVIGNELDKAFEAFIGLSDGLFPDQSAKIIFQRAQLNKSIEQQQLKLISTEDHEVDMANATRFLFEELDTMLAAAKKSIFNHPKVLQDLEAKITAFSATTLGLIELVKWAKAQTDQKTEIFIGPKLCLLYAPEDNSYAEELKKAMFLLEEQKFFKLIDLSEQIELGEDWAKIEKLAVKARLNLLLVSNSILYRYLDLINKMHKAEARLVPVLIGDTDLTGTVLNRLKKLPSDKVPISQLQHPEKAYTEIAITLRNYFQRTA